MSNFFRQYWPLAVTLLTTLAAVASSYAIYGFRIAALEARQDRQGATIASIQTQLTTQAQNYAELKATLQAMSDNLNYIRNRVDRLTQ